eukprot:GGOE01053495.1.p1 GENE.GGOE01053495.1~~GGOE01053495.1.p1  ORF type:complete len:305 (+),score=27.90 GGOE01053495.1:15-929(+)
MAHFIPFPDKFHLADEYMKTNVPLEASDCPLKTECRLAFYSLRQQALHGENRTPAPSRWNVTDRAKWDAWTSLGRMSQLEAMVFFVQLVEKEVDSDWLSKVAPPLPAPEQHDNPDDSTETTSPCHKDEASTLAEEVKCQDRSRPGTEEEMWAALQSAWQQLEAMAAGLVGKEQGVAELRDQLHAERQTSEMLRQQNGMLQARLQEVLQQQNIEGRSKLVPKRRAQMNKKEQPQQNEENGFHGDTSNIGVEKENTQGNSPLDQPMTPTFDPSSITTASPADARIVNYYYSSDTSQEGWWGWLRPW